MLVVKGLWKSFRPTVRGEQAQAAVAGVDLTVPTGTLASVLGPSGSGKTTLLRCIAGFERPDAGMIMLGERVLFSAGIDLPAHARRVGVVPQEGALFPHLNVAQNIGFGLSGLSRGDRRERVEQLLDLVGLHGLGGRRPDQLSGGQQQRVALARALAPEPALILLDEPFSALDARLRADLREEVRALLRSLGTTAVLVTHDQAEAMSLSDHLVVLRDGQAVAAGEPREVYSSPADPEVAGFLGEVLVVSGTVSRGADGIRVDCGLGSLEVGRWHGEEGPCRVLIRPEQIRVRPLEAAQPVPHVVGSVESHSYFGHDALVRVSVPGVEHPVSVRVPGKQACRVGDRAALEIVESVVTYSA